MFWIFTYAEPTYTWFDSETVGLGAMDKSAMCCLIDANQNLKNEIWDLREIAANLDTEKQDIIMDSKAVREQNKSLEAKIDCFKALVEDFQKEEEDLQVTLRQLEGTVVQLESQNKALKGTNQTLQTEIQEVSGHFVLFQDYEALQEQDICRMKQVMERVATYFKQLETRIETAEQRYRAEQSQAAELQCMLDEVEQICEVQESEIARLRDQLEEALWFRPETDVSADGSSLLHEMVQAKLIQDSLAMQSCILLLLSKAMWLMFAMVVCLGFLSASVKLYVFMFGQDLESGSWLLLLSDHVWLLSEVVPHHVREADGLLPF
ncbi:Chromosome partition protein Smc [Varanus komodoensis]|nr:Chromosome partition protein Smc [Varanus komodoensis]